MLTERPVDGITLLKNDHRAVKKLFREFQQAHKKGTPGRAKIVGQIVAELSVHAAIEEAILYPAVRAEVPDLEDDILESIEEHHGVKWTCLELTKMQPSDELYDVSGSRPWWLRVCGVHSSIITHGWAVAEGDPAGPYEFIVTIDGQIRRNFTLVFEEEKAEAK